MPTVTSQGRRSRHAGHSPPVDCDVLHVTTAVRRWISSHSTRGWGEGEGGDEQCAGCGVRSSLDEQRHLELRPVTTQDGYVDRTADDRAGAVEQVAGEAGDMAVAI